MATPSSILAWRIPWTEESGGLSLGSHKELDTTERLNTHSTQRSETVLVFCGFIFWPHHVIYRILVPQPGIKPTSCPVEVQHLNHQTTMEVLPCSYSSVLCLVTQSCPTLCNPMDCSPPGSSVLGDSPDKSTGVGCHSFLQGIFPTQESNWGLLHGRDSLPTKPAGKPS